MKKWLYLGIFDLILIIILSLISGASLKKISFTDIASIDKLGHCAFYGFASFCFSMHMKINKFKTIFQDLLVFTILFTLGLTLEFLQYACAEGRFFDLLDQLANTIGIISGLFIAGFLFAKLNSSKLSKNA